MPIKNFDEQRTTEAASILLKLNGGTMNYMKLIKLLYFIDKESFRQWERPITYDNYCSMKNGQVLSHVLDLFNGKIPGQYWNDFIYRSSQYEFSLSKEIKIMRLTKGEIKLIEDVYGRLGKMDQYQLGDLTKEGSEYQKTSHSSIPTPIDAILADLDFSDEDILEIKENLAEYRAIDEALGV
jgi:hypothetical protein